MPNPPAAQCLHSLALVGPRCFPSVCRLLPLCPPGGSAPSGFIQTFASVTCPPPLLHLSPQQLRMCIVLVLSRFSHVPTLFSPMDHSPLGSSVHGILQARRLERIPFSGDLPAPGIQPALLVSGVGMRSLPLAPPGKPTRVFNLFICCMSSVTRS